MIGEPKGDAVRNVVGTLGSVFGNFQARSTPFYSIQDTVLNVVHSEGNYHNYSIIAFNLGNTVPTDTNNHPAQMAVAKYMHY